MYQIKAWREPPVIRGKPNDPRPIERKDPCSDIAGQLKAHPDEWAEIDIGQVNSAYEAVTLIKDGRYRSVAPAGSFHAVARTEGGITKVFAKFVGT